MSIQVAIVDDHHLIISSVKAALEFTGYIKVVNTYTSGEDAVEGLKTTQPDVLIIDYHLPGRNGAELARHVTYHYPDVKILALTGFDKPGLAYELLESGCSGYLLKVSARPEMIAEAVSTVYSGKIYIDIALKESFAKIIRQREEQVQEKPKLTKRELEVLKGIIDESSNQEIADKLNISKRTVDNHRNSIIAKVGAKNTAGIIKFAMKMNLFG